MIELNQAERQTTKRRRTARDGRKARKEEIKMLKKMRTSKRMTAEALSGIINECGQLDSEYLENLANIYLRNDYELYNRVRERHTLTFKVWDVLLTVLNNQMPEAGYVATAQQVREILADVGLSSFDLLGVCEEALTRELSED